MGTTYCLTNQRGHDKCTKAHYDQHVFRHSLHEGDLLYVFNLAKEKLGLGKFKTLWHDPYIVKHNLDNGAYVLSNHDG